MFALIIACFANTWYVDVNAAPPGNGSQVSPYTSIQYALDQSSTLDGDTLFVAPGTYVENVILEKRVLVHGTAGPGSTELRSPGFGTIVESTTGAIAAPVPWGPTLRGFTIHGGANPSSAGAGVVVYQAFLLLDHCVITGFTSGVAVLKANTSYLRLEQCTIARNQYGLFNNSFNSGTVEAWSSIIRDNVSDFVGLSGTTTLYNCCVPPVAVPYGWGNFSTAPGFWNGQGGDFRLKPLSPCIDTGNAIMQAPDPDGSPPDVGAFAYDPLYAPFPASYCTRKTNSLGCAVTITSTGEASLSGPDNFFLTATSALNNKPGLFIWSRAPKATPFSGGTLCLDSPIVRGPAISSGGSPSGNDCTGIFRWHFSQAYMASKSITAGSILYAQAWGRDNGFAPPDNAQLSDARVFPVVP